MPIIFSSDETKVSNQGKSYSWPIMFTTSILNQETRNKSSVWYLVEFIPDFKLATSANEEKQFGKHLKSRKLHQALKVILKSFVDFQKKGHEKPISLTFGKHKKRLKLKTPCFFIIGNMQGGDKWLVQQQDILTKWKGYVINVI